MALLAGCAGGPQYWDHGEWLDRVSVRPANPVQHTAAEQERLRAEADRLRAQGEALRLQMAAEKSRDRRIAQLGQLEDIGIDLRAVESALQGGPMPHDGHLEQPGNPGA
jgi:hypothetical protein